MFINLTNLNVEIFSYNFSLIIPIKESQPMKHIIETIIYLIFISLGLPDSLLGLGWPVIQKEFNVDSSYAGYISMATYL